MGFVANVNPHILSGAFVDLPPADHLSAGTIYHAIDTDQTFIIEVDPVTNTASWELMATGAGGPPTGPAGGDLAGTYPDPTLAANINTSVTWGGTQVFTNPPTVPTPLAGTDAANKDYVDAAIPAALPPSGPAGGDLDGTYPDPTLASSILTPVTWGGPQQFDGGIASSLGFFLNGGDANNVVFGADGAAPGDPGEAATFGSGNGADGDAGNDGAAGGISLYESGQGGAGTAARPAGAGGRVIVRSGNGGTNNGGGGAAAGVVEIDTGTATGAATNADVTIGATNAEGVKIGRAGKTVTLGHDGGKTNYRGGTLVTSAAQGVNFTADSTVSRYELTATGLTVTLGNDPDGTTFEFWNRTKSATPNTTFLGGGGTTVNIAGSYTQASININTDWVARTVTKLNGEWWIGS